MGVVVWPMIEFEADDALASAAHLAAGDEQVQKVCIWTPDKDLAQCVVGERVVQVDRRSGQIRDEHAIHAKFGVVPTFIPDYLALVGDAADGYPGIPGLGPKTAATLINRYGHIEQFPVNVLKEENLERRCSSNTSRRCESTYPRPAVVLRRRSYSLLSSLRLLSFLHVGTVCNESGTGFLCDVAEETVIAAPETRGLI